MWSVVLKAMLVFVFSMLKFILGPLQGYAYKLNILTTIVCTVAGMMTSVVAFTYFGNWLRERFFKKSYDDTNNGSKNIRLLKFIKRYGLGGIAFLTPVFLTPIGGTILAVSTGNSKEKIIFYMFVSATAWAIMFSVTIYFFGHKMLPDFVK